MRNLLAETGSNWPLRSSRTQVLGIVAASTNVMDAWLAEEPDSHDARVMLARVAVERAMRAHRLRHGAAWGLEYRARRAALVAADGEPQDPVPWLCRLSLAQIDTRQAWREHREEAAEPMLPTGPWGLFHQVEQRDPGNREAYHRMMHFLLARQVLEAAALAEVMDFGRWGASKVHDGSPLLLLPIYAMAELCRRRAAYPRSAVWRLQWSQEPMLGYTLRAFHLWFRNTDPVLRSVTDLSHLACALWAAHKLAEASEVFDALGPYATREPWASVHDYGSRPDAPAVLFLRARTESAAAAAKRRPPTPLPVGLPPQIAR
ncbi:hypothetical protein CG747_46215 [Streptomyces sp. CB02959]|uniref:hypothetical protein n=1 Tax=Streptomyces sp. CB02959 TaxID=2020330 RepID=UPI000C27AFD2|nr:hypothetical protein [Streptomyces sp. CB02959]PJN28616.1 hypothetical protein CG747_46215 [Streptomyces sp. CB02959]